jgi:hypothetical protein
MLRLWTIALCVLGAAWLGGCASYATPGGPAPLSKLADADINAAMARQPTAHFPANLAIVRVQAPGYRSCTADSYGHGRYSVVTTRDVEKDEHFQRLQKLPMVAGVAPLNRLLISPELQSAKELRVAAASLRADLVVVYTFDTTFWIKDHEVGPLQLISLGFLPNQEARVTTTASAILLDVRTGYLYGTAEATARQSQIASLWRSEQAADETRQKTESRAMDALIGEVETTWARVLRQHVTPEAVSSSPGVHFNAPR